MAKEQPLVPPRRSFERRLLLALLLFSILPSLLLLGGGSYLLSRVMQLHTSPAAWEQVRSSGQDLLQRANASGDPELVEAAQAHREVLDFSLQQSRLWEYINARMLRVIPVMALVLGALMVFLAVRSSRRMAHSLARPIHELVGWSERVAREEPLPPPSDADEEAGEFVVLQQAFRRMVSELALSRGRALEAERARTWMTMARGVAHELKNSLTPLQLALRTIENTVDGDGPIREPLEVATAESARLEELARSFAHFGHLPESPMSEIDLREMLEYLLRTHLSAPIQHQLSVPDHLPRIYGHHDALSRAFANLLLNSAEAIGEGTGEVRVELAAENGQVSVRILDSGPGIPRDQLSRIWDPDFTTKSRGTGLGLALVRQTVQAHGGTIAAANRPAGGAEFRVELPVDGPASETTRK